MLERLGEMWEAMSALNWTFIWNTLTEIFADAWNQMDPFAWLFGVLFVGVFLLLALVGGPIMYIFGMLS